MSLGWIWSKSDEDQNKQKTIKLFAFFPTSNEFWSIKIDGGGNYCCVASCCVALLRAGWARSRGGRRPTSFSLQENFPRSRPRVTAGLKHSSIFHLADEEGEGKGEAVIVSGAAFKRAKQPLRLQDEEPQQLRFQLSHIRLQKRIGRDVRCNFLEKEQRQQQSPRWQTMQSTVADGSVQTAPNSSEKKTTHHFKAALQLFERNSADVRKTQTEATDSVQRRGRERERWSCRCAVQCG